MMLGVDQALIPGHLRGRECSPICLRMTKGLTGLMLSVMLLTPVLAASNRAVRATPSSQQTSTPIEIEVGHAHVLTVSSAKQVAVGNSQTLQANAPNAKEVILFGKRAGSTSVDIWDHKGQRRSFHVTVHAAGRMQVLEEIRSLLGEVEAVRVMTAGGHIVLQADGLSSSQRQRVDKILTRFPDVVDMTASMSWDPMVLLDVMVIEMPTYKLSEMGVRWQAGESSSGYAGLAWQVGRSIAPGQPTSTSINQGAVAPVASWMGVNAMLQAQIQSMADRGEAVLLAQPQLMTRHGKTASFLAGGEVPYAVTDNKGRTHTEFKKYGVSLNVTPEIGQHGRITASVEVEVSAVDPAIVTAAGPAMRVRKAMTEFNAYSGQTMVLAGFMSSDRSLSYEGVPVQERSLFERLAGVGRDRSRQTELAILVTPVLTQADDPAMKSRVRRANAYAQVESAPTQRLLAPVDHDQAGESSQWIDGLDDTLEQAMTGVDQWGDASGTRESRQRDTATDDRGHSRANDAVHDELSSPWERFNPGQTSEQWVQDRAG